jgi:hypothetical protein
MFERVLCQVFGTFEDVDKDPLGRDVRVDGARDEERRKSQTVGDPLDQDASASLEARRFCSAAKEQKRVRSAILTKAGLAIYCPA